MCKDLRHDQPGNGAKAYGPEDDEGQRGNDQECVDLEILSDDNEEVVMRTIIQEAKKTDLCLVWALRVTET